jgi:hypothetical protein
VSIQGYEAVVGRERPQYDLTLFKVHFGVLTLKGYTKGERVLHPRRRHRREQAPQPGRARRRPCAGHRPDGFTVADFTAKVRDITGQTGYTIRNAAYDLRKLRGKHLADKPGRTRRYLISAGAARIISALLTLASRLVGIPTFRKMAETL